MCPRLRCFATFMPGAQHGPTCQNAHAQRGGGIVHSPKSHPTASTAGYRYRFRHRYRCGATSNSLRCSRRTRAANFLIEKRETIFALRPPLPKPTRTGCGCGTGGPLYLAEGGRPMGGAWVGLVSQRATFRHVAPCWSVHFGNLHLQLVNAPRSLKLAVLLPSPAQPSACA